MSETMPSKSTLNWVDDDLLEELVAFGVTIMGLVYRENIPKISDILVELLITSNRCTV